MINFVGLPDRWQIRPAIILNVAVESSLGDAFKFKEFATIDLTHIITRWATA